MRRSKPDQDFKLVTNRANTVKDQDNVQPKPKPPMHIERPRLAPPGMSGVKPSASLYRQSPKPEKFKSLVSNFNRTGKEIER